MLLLMDRTFGPFALGKIVATSGTWMQSVTSAVVMFELTQSAFMVGLVSAIMFGGPLVLALWAGALSDRHDRRKLVLIGRILSGTSVTALSLLISIREIDAFGGPTVLILMVGVVGAGMGLSNPAMQAMVPGLVADENLEGALALSSVAPSIARTLGPVAGAATLAVGGPALAYGIAAIADWSFVLILMFFVKPRQELGQKRDGDILRGIRHVLVDRKLGILVLAVAAIGHGADPVLTLTPAIAVQFDGNRSTVGMMIGAFGGGSILLVFCLRWLRSYMSLRLTGMIGFWVLAVGLMGAAFASNLTSAMVAFFVAGFGFMMASVTINTRIQRRVPEQLRGRVMALWTAAFLGWRPFAALVDGAIADRYSPQAALALSAVVVGAASAMARVRFAPQVEAGTDVG